MAHSERFFNGNAGSTSYRNHTMAPRGRTRALGRNRGSNRIIEDGQPNDGLSRNRDNIPSVRAAYRPSPHVRKRGISVSHSRRTTYDHALKKDPPTGPRALSSITPTNIPSCPTAKRPSTPSLDDLAPRKRRRTESPSLIAPNAFTHPASPTSANHEHSLPRVACPRPCTIVADAAVRCEPFQLDSPVNAKRENSPVDISSLISVDSCSPSTPLFKKLGLPEKTSGSYHIAMIDQCKKGAASYMERRREWEDSVRNAVRFARGHNSPPLTIERCFIRSDGLSIDWSVPKEAPPNNNAASSGFGAITIPAPTLRPSTAPSPAVGRAASPAIRRIAPLPTSAPARPIESLLVGVSNVDEVPVGSIGSSTRSTTRILPKGITSDALPVKVIDVPEYLLGEDMRKDRYDWKNRVIIELGNPNYKGAFAPVREKGPEGKWRVSGSELHIYDAGEKNLPALPKEIHQEPLKDNVVDPMRNMSRTIEETLDAENHSTDSPIPHQRTTTPTDRKGTLFSVLESLTRQKSPSFALASQRFVSQENATEHNRIPTSRERNSAQQRAPQIYSSTTSATNEASTSAAQSKKHVSDHKEPVSPPSFTTIAPFGTSPKAHLPRTVAPMRLSRNTLLSEEPVLSSISALLIIKPEPEFGPILVPPSASPEAVLPRPPSQAATQPEPSRSLSRIEFDSSFCSGSNTVESLYDIAGGFLRRFFGYLDSTEEARIWGGYSEKAIMSWQLNNLPSLGVCPHVGNPQAQGHQITEVPRWVGRNLLLQGQKTRHPVRGKIDIIRRLETMSGLKLTPSPDCNPEYEYEALDLGIGGLVQVRCWGNLHKMINDESHVALRFERTFILEKNYGAAKIVWPWVVLNDQMTLFHRPGIVCQCLGG